MIHMLYMSLPWHDSQGIYLNHLILQSTVTTKSETISANCHHKIQLHLKCLPHSYFLAARQLHIDCNAMLQYLVFYASKTIFCVSLNAFNCIGGERFKYPHNFSTVEYPKPISLITNTDETFMSNGDFPFEFKLKLLACVNFLSPFWTVFATEL